MAKRRGRKPIVRSTKIFDGKLFHIYDSYWAKYKAQEDAKALRKKGMHARITKQSTGAGKYYYSVWRSS